MTYVPPFFERYDLDINADERDIKRAYARALKKIDQETDPAAFQDLREHYEHALSWMRHRDYQRQLELEEVEQASDVVPEQSKLTSASTLTSIPQNTQTEAIPAAPPNMTAGVELASEPPQAETIAYVPASEQSTIAGITDIPDTAAPQETTAESGNPEIASIQDHQAQITLPTPPELADAVFQELLQTLQHLPQATATAEAASRTLQEFLDDMRLIQIDAKDIFEWRVLCHVVNGWQPGNGELLGAAIQLFQWDKDKQRLQRFGHPGNELDTALIEHTGFIQQEQDAISSQWTVIQRTRNEAMPDTQYLTSKLLPVTEYLIERFPNWLALAGNRENIERWREFARSISADTTPRAVFNEKSKAPPVEERAWFNNWGVWIFILFLIKAIAAISTQ
jgi:hypothetical protein